MPRPWPTASPPRSALPRLAKPARRRSPGPCAGSSETLAHERSLVVVLEDLHWAEPTLLDLVEYLAVETRDAPPRTRLPRAARAPGGATALGRRPAQRHLAPPDAASPEGERAVARGTARRRAAGRSDAHRIADAAEGNPLFLEQLLALLREGVELGDEPLLPPTIAALLAARLDRLGPGELAVLEGASVVGKEFWPEAVAELLPVEAKPSIGRHLDALVRKEFIKAAGREDFQFGHVLIQQAAYRAVPKERRAEHHERFAAWLTAGPSSSRESSTRSRAITSSKRAATETSSVRSTMPARLPARPPNGSVRRAASLCARRCTGCGEPARSRGRASRRGRARSARAPVGAGGSPVRSGGVWEDGDGAGPGHSREQRPRRPAARGIRRHPACVLPDADGRRVRRGDRARRTDNPSLRGA